MFTGTRVKKDTVLFRGRHILSYVALGIIIASPFAGAQPSLNFMRVINNWPTIELYFSVTCDGQPAYFSNPRYFQIMENGREMEEYELWCPDASRRYSISAALVFGANVSMIGEASTRLKEAGHSFINLFDGLTDEAAILWYNNSVTLAQPMTSNLALLHAAIDSLPAGGATALFDGIRAGIEELNHAGSSERRVVIAFTDGLDVASNHGANEVIALANQNLVRVCVIGLGNVVNGSVLSEMAARTGGRYYETAGTSQLVGIYQEIALIIRQAFQECIITYMSHCMDGSTRTVDLSLSNFCGGSETHTKIFKAPKDTSTFIPLNMRLGRQHARSRQIVRLPLELLDPISPALPFHPASWSVNFDEACVRFVAFRTPPGSLLEAVPISVLRSPGRVELRTTQPKLLEVLNTPAVLGELEFETSDTGGRDTVYCDIALRNWTFTAGCFRPVLRDGWICIPPGNPRILCDISGPASILWDSASASYRPESFIVSSALVNTGDRDARNARMKIEYDSQDIALVSPRLDNQSVNPGDIAPAALVSGSWELRARAASSGHWSRICIVSAFDNHDSVRACLRLWIPRASGSTTAVNAPAPLPKHVGLRVAPHPVASTATVSLELHAPSYVSLDLVDCLGRTVRTLACSALPAGMHAYNFDVHGLPPGYYNCIARTLEGVTLIPMIIGK